MIMTPRRLPRWLLAALLGATAIGAASTVAVVTAPTSPVEAPDTQTDPVVVEASPSPATAPLAAVPEPPAPLPPAPPIFSTASTVDSLDLPLTSQRAAVAYGGGIALVGLDGGRVTVVLPDGTRSSLGTGSGPSVGVVGGELRVAYVHGPSVMLARWDGAKWSTAVVGTKTGTGGSLPVVCGDTVSWVDQAVTDGGGPLYVGSTRIADSASTVSCTHEGVYWRDQRDGSRGATTRRAGLDGTGEEIVVTGYDASAAACGDVRLVGYHTGSASAYVAISRAGGPWEPTLLDDSAKFVSVACSGASWMASWADYTDRAAASTARASDSSRRLGVVVDGVEHRPAGEAVGQVKGHALYVDGRPAVVWGDAGAVRVEGVRR